MDQRDTHAGQESCPSAEFVAESGYVSAAVRKSSPLSERIQPANDQESVDVTSMAGEREDGVVVDSVLTKDSTRPVGGDGDCHLLCTEDAKNRCNVPGHIASVDNVLLDPCQQPVPVSPGEDMILRVHDDHMNIRLESSFLSDVGQCALASAHSLQQMASNHCLHESAALVTDDGGHTSLEMLSVAVERLENMKRESRKACNNIRSSSGRPEQQRLLLGDDSEDFSVEMEKDHANNLSTRESGDNESSVSDDSSAPSTDSQVKERVLNMLCELAAVHQREPELLRISKQVSSCMTSLSDNVTDCDEPRWPSFVNLLQKQKVHTGDLSDLTTDATCMELVKENEDLFGPELVKDQKLMMPLTASLSKEDAVVTLESDCKSFRISNKEDANPSMNDLVDHLKSGEFMVLEKNGAVSEEGTGDMEKSYVVGELVWAKVKSHPWWPGQIFDASDASSAAKKIQKPGRVLVGFFGDGTFGWLQQSQLIPFIANFSEKVKQTTMKSFCRAVVEALDEISRCMELGLKCSHSGDTLYSPNMFPDLNAGIRKGVRHSSHRDIETGKELFNPEMILTFVQTVARAPLYPLSSGLEYSKLCGQVYGFRSFMLSPKREKSKVTPLNSPKLTAQKRRKSLQTSVSKRKARVDESGDLCSADGKASKRFCLSKDAGDEAMSVGGMVVCPKLKSIETCSLTKTEESKVSEHEAKFHEQGDGNSFLAKGNCQVGSLDGKQKKRMRGVQSLGPSGDAQESGCETTRHISSNSDDDNRTLLDLTGYHSLKRKKKSACEGSAEVPIKDADSKLLEAKQESSQKQFRANFDGDREKGLDLPDCDMLCSSILGPCLPPAKEECTFVEGSSKDGRCHVLSEYSGSRDEDAVTVVLEGSKDGGYHLISRHSDSQDADAGVGNEDTHVINLVENTTEDKRDQFDLRDAVVSSGVEVKEEGVDDSMKGSGDAEGGNNWAAEDLDVKDASVLESKQLRRESVASKVVCEEVTSQQEGNLLVLKGNNAEESLNCELGLAMEDRRVCDKGGELLIASIVEKSEKKNLNTEVEGELQAGFTVRKQLKGLHSERCNSLNSSIKKQKNVPDVRNKSSTLSSSVMKDEQLNPARMFKKSATLKKVAGALKGGLVDSNSAHSITLKDGLFAGAVKCKVSKGTRKLDSDHSLVRSHTPTTRSGLNHMNSNIRLLKLLSRLQDIAKDPLSSANMRNCLGGVMPALLRFRSMVFVKSSGYAAGKVIAPTMKDSFSHDKNIGDKAWYGKKSHALGMHQMGEQDSSVEAKGPPKAETISRNMGVSGSKKLAEPESSCEATAVATAECLSQKISARSGPCVSKAVADNEAAVVDTALLAHGNSVCNERSCQQDFTSGGHKQRSVLPESASKVFRESETPRKSSEKLAKERDAEMRHHVKRKKHHASSVEGLSPLEKKSPVKGSTSAKVALGLFMQFQEDYTLPTETELREVFSKFGILEKFGIRVYRNTSTAQVVFKHRDDAEAAWQHARKNRMFGQANVSYRLRYFSLSSKSHSLASAKKGSLEIKQSAESLRRPVLAKHLTALPQMASPLHSHFATGESLDRVNKKQVQEVSLTDGALTRSCEPILEGSSVRDSSEIITKPEGLKMVGQLPIQVAIPSKSTIVPGLSPVQDIMEGKAVSGAIRAAEPAPVQVGLTSMTDSSLGYSSASRLQSMLPVSPGLGIPLSSGPDLGASVGASVMHQREAMQRSHQPDVTFTESANQSSVPVGNLTSGDIQDEMLKLLQQVSRIVSSTGYTNKSA